MGTLISKLFGTNKARRQEQVVYFVSEGEAAFSNDGTADGKIKITRVVEVSTEMAAGDETEALERKLIGATWAAW